MPRPKADAPLKGSTVEALYLLIKSGKKASLEDLAKKYFSAHKNPEGSAATTMRQARLWLNKEGLYTCNLNGKYQLTDKETQELNINPRGGKPVGPLTRSLMKRFEDGEKISAKEIAEEHFSHLPEFHAVARAYAAAMMVKRQFVRQGLSFGTHNKAYQLLDETNIIRVSDTRTKQLQGWMKNVQEEIDIGISQFGSDPLIREALSEAVFGIQEHLIASGRKSFKLLGNADPADSSGSDKA